MFIMSEEKNSVVQGFTEEQVSRLTGVSVHQLRGWDRTDFFKPALAQENRRLSFARLYSFRDLLSLQILNTLRNESKVPLQHLRKVREELLEMGDQAWTRTTLYVLKKKVVFVDPQDGVKREIVGGQGVLGIPLEAVRADMRNRIETTRIRNAEVLGTVTKNRMIARNAEVFAGTRIPVRAVEHFIEDGATDDEIIAEYPRLTIKDIQSIRGKLKDAA